MPISFDHLRDKVQVWDGESVAVVASAEAKRLAAAGTHQITTGLRAMDLLTKEQLAEAAEAKEQRKAKRKIYKTREMKADG